MQKVVMKRLDDEGNRIFTGMSQGTRGLHDMERFYGRGKRQRNYTEKSPEQKAYEYADQMGVDKKDVERYIKDAKGNIAAVFKRIKYKALKNKRK